MSRKRTNFILDKAGQNPIPEQALSSQRIDIFAAVSKRLALRQGVFCNLHLFFCSMTPGIRNGFLGGAVVIFYFALLYVAKQNLFLSPLFQWGSLIFYLFFMVRAALEDNAAQGTARDFREQVRTPFVAFLLVNLCYWLFYYGLHLFDPSLLQAEMTLELNMLKSQLSAGLGDPEQANKFRERIQDLEKTLQTPQPQPLGPVVTRMCVGALGGFGLAALVVLGIKNRKP